MRTGLTRRFTRANRGQRIPTDACSSAPSNLHHVPCREKRVLLFAWGNWIGFLDWMSGRGGGPAELPGWCSVRTARLTRFFARRRECWWFGLFRAGVR